MTTERIAELEAENVTFRNAQKACETCDGPTIAEFKELKAEVAAMERERESLNASWHSRCLRTEIRAEAAESKLRAVAELPDEWRSRTTRNSEVDLCAMELEALLKGERK